MATSEDRQAAFASKVRQDIARETKKAKEKDLNVWALSEKEIIRKLERVDSPFFSMVTYSNPSVGGDFSYVIGLANPDPHPWPALYIYTFVGPANAVRNLGNALQCVDDRFARLTDGVFTIDEESTGSRPPLPGGYLMNMFLFQITGAADGIGRVFDRAAFTFQVRA